MERLNRKAFMKLSVLQRVLLALTFTLVILALAMPLSAYAAKPDVQVDNHTAAGAQLINGITIDGVEAPQIGNALDDTANVSTAQGETWDIPVLWVGEDLELAQTAVEGRSYLPVLAFYVPQEYSLEGSSFTVTLSSSLTALFGDEDAISVYDAKTGITYILPASLKDYFARARIEIAEKTDASESVLAEAVSSTSPRTLIEIYCANTARDVLTDEDLEYLIDLILHKLEPQAVELLLKSFPAFRAAADQGQIGTQIGLYIYYLVGDKDGKPEHESASNALAYVAGDEVMRDGGLRYCYMIGVDIDDLLVKDANEQPVKNESTGKFMLLRDGPKFVTFNNTVVHELFHAFMDDYNRTGMAGGKDIAAVYTPGGTWVSPEQKALYKTYHFPRWFIEGTASAVENNYQFRYYVFQNFRALRDDPNSFAKSFTSELLLHNYLNAKSGVFDLNFGLEHAEDEDNADNARYVSGYLASLYLAQLAAQKDPSIGSAVQTDSKGNVVVLSENLRMGLNSILERLHNDVTLDQVINEISPHDETGASVYADTSSFENEFIKGKSDGDKTYSGDKPSIDFTLDFLNYMLDLEGQKGREFRPNGSILFDFDADFSLPLDPEKESTSDILQIIDSNEFVESSVSSSTVDIGAGKTDPNASVTNLAAASADDVPMAAKVPAEDGAHAEPASDDGGVPAAEE